MAWWHHHHDIDIDRYHVVNALYSTPGHFSDFVLIYINEEMSITFRLSLKIQVRENVDAYYLCVALGWGLPW